MRFETGSVEIDVTIARRAALDTTVARHLADREGFALATLNLDHLVKLRSDPAFATAYRAQDIVVADGNPIVWLSRLAGRPVELMPGSELIVPLARIAAREGATVALVGSHEAALAGAAKALANAAPGLKVVLTHAPEMGFDPVGASARRIAMDIAAAGAGLCFVALGAPKQERFADFARQFAPQTGFVSIGAGLDFLSGDQTRAPRWVRALALEWLWRVLSNPRRMAGRYLRCIAILPRQIGNALAQRRAARD